MEWIALGSLIISGASFLWNAISGGKQQDIAEEGLDLEKVNAYQSSLSNLTAIEQQQETLKNQITASEGKITEYDQFLERFPAYAEFQTQSALQEGKQVYEEMATNFAFAELGAAARGQTGSTGIASAQRTKKAVNLFGEDMKADAFGGLFGQQMQELSLDLTSMKTEAQRNKQVLGTSLSSLKTTLGTYDTTLATQQGIVNKLKQEAGL